MLSCCRGGDDPAIDNHDDDTEPVHHDKLTKESLKYEFGRQKHDHCMCQNHEERAFCRCADEDTVAIVDAIGGLYTVFDALCQSTIRLNQYQMHRIHKLMTIKPIFRRRTRLVEKKPLFDLPDWIEDLAGLSEDTILEKKKHPQQIRSGLQPALIYGFDEDNHRLSLIPNKLGKAVFHGRALVVFCTIWMIWALFNRMDGHSYSYYLFTSIVYPLYLIPHCIGFLLGFNKKAFVLVMKVNSIYVSSCTQITHYLMLNISDAHKTDIYFLDQNGSCGVIWNHIDRIQALYSGRVSNFGGYRIELYCYTQHIGYFGDCQFGCDSKRLDVVAMENWNLSILECVVSIFWCSLVVSGGCVRNGNPTHWRPNVVDHVDV